FPTWHNATVRLFRTSKTGVGFLSRHSCLMLALPENRDWAGFGRDEPSVRPVHHRGVACRGPFSGMAGAMSTSGGETAMRRFSPNYSSANPCSGPAGRTLILPGGIGFKSVRARSGLLHLELFQLW